MDNDLINALKSQILILEKRPRQTKSLKKIIANYYKLLKKYTDATNPN